MENMDAVTNSLSLMTTSNDSGLTTSGNINWDALLRSAVNVSVGILSRISAAGVDAYTVVVGQKLGSTFQLTSLVRQQITKTVAGLRCFGGVGQILWFGFGIKHLVRVLARTEEGKLCILLCASLAECYESSIAAEILIEMAKSTQAPEELLPSILEWKALIEASAGILVSTEFPQLAETYMSLYPLTRDFAFVAAGFNPRRVTGCSTPESLAKVLLAIGRISRGDLEAVTIVGGPDGGWIAAFAEWHFQFSVRIIDGSSQRVLYESPNFRDQSSITIVYEHRPNDDPVSAQLTASVYSLQDASSLIVRERRDGRAEAACVSGRISWASAFTKVFGPEFRKLQDNSILLGCLIGCASRILKAVATAEKGDTVRFPPGGEFFEEFSYGRAFSNGLCSRFAELHALEHHITIENDLQLAITKFDANISVLRHICGCRFCNHDYESLQEQYCLVYVVETIIVIGQLLSAIDLPVEMNMSRLGCLELYRRQMHTHRELHENLASSDDAFKVFGNAAFIFRKPSPHLLFDALELFGGRQNQSYWQDPTGGSRHCAVSRNGLCAYWQAIDPSMEGVLQGRVCVVPGKIEFRGKVSKDLLEPVGGAYIHDACNLSDWRPAMKDASVKVRETTDGLMLHFEIPKTSSSSSSRNHTAEQLIVRPAASIRGFLQSRGHVWCSRQVCPKIESLELNFVVNKEEGKFVQYHEESLESDVFFLTGLTMQQWAIANSALLKFFVTDECDACCLRAALVVLRGPYGPGKLYVIRNHA